MIVAQNYGATGGTTFVKGDFNYDGKVDFQDLVAMAQNYGTALPSPAPGGSLTIRPRWDWLLT